jgi:hypothetical protein
LYDDVAKLIAEASSENLREIEGAILKLEAYSGIQKKEITLEFAKELLSTKEKIKHDPFQYIEDENEIDVLVDEIENTKDPKYEEAVLAVITHRVASASFLSRMLGIGYHKAAGLIEEMEQKEIIGHAIGSKPRKVLISAPKETNFSDRTAMIRNTPISNIVGRYISLEKKGEYLQAVCPFHADTNQSLKVNDSKGMFKCFVCGAGGDAITFVKDFKKIEFSEAIKEIEGWEG